MNRFRTLVRVLCVDSEGPWCIFPAWDSRCAVLVTSIPFSVVAGQRFHCTVFLGCDIPQDLQPEDFEV